jgi:hypothetical protein
MKLRMTQQIYLLLAVLIDELMTCGCNDGIEDRVLRFQLGVSLYGVQAITSKSIQVILKISKNFKSLIKALIKTNQKST